MINLHLYRSTFINESRVNREINTLEELNIFKEIHLVGVNNDELPKMEKISKSTIIFRFLRRRKNDTKLIIGTKIFLWYLQPTKTSFNNIDPIYLINRKGFVSIVQHKFHSTLA